MSYKIVKKCFDEKEVTSLKDLLKDNKFEDSTYYSPQCGRNIIDKTKRSSNLLLET